MRPVTRNNETSSTRRRLGALGVLAAAGAILLGACGGTSLPVTHEGVRPTSRHVCHSLISCLTSKATHRGEATRRVLSPPPSAPSQRAVLGPSALGPLANGLSPANQQLILAAMDSLSPGAASSVTARLDQLDPADVSRLQGDLSAALGADPAQAQAYADALVGTGSTAPAAAVAQAELQELSSALGNLPGALANGNSQTASFVSEILSTTLPHIEQMMESGLAQIPAQAVPIALADVNVGLAKASPTEVGDYVALLEDPSAEALATRTAYQAGYACGSTLYGTCSPFDQWVLSVSGLKTAPSLIQQDIVDCVLLPLCTQVQYQGVISWVDQVAVASSASAAEVQGLSAEMEANSYVATERWLEAL